MVSTHKLNRLFGRIGDARTNSAVQGGSPGVPNPPWVAPPAGQSADRLGYDGAGRMIAKRYIASYSSPSAIVGFTTGFDRASNKYYERALHAENRSHLYEPYDAVSNLPTGGYDSLDRLLQYQRGTLSSTGGDGGNGGGSIAVSGSTTQYINLSGTDFQRSYALDSLGNWRNTAFTPSTTGTPTPETEIRQHNLLNEITLINNPAATPVTINPTYDLNGNLTSAGTPAFTWDALNRLATASPGGAYYYDALNRRVSKTVSDVQTDFIYSGWRCVEDRNPGAEDGDGPIAQYVWGRYLDELLQITTLVYITTGSGDSSTAYSPGTYFPLQDMLYRTTATVTISEDGVAIVEAYDFDAYGKTLIFNAVGTGPNWWGPDAPQSPNSLCQFLFTGQRFDAETGLYYYKQRMYSAGLGRFLSRDPVKKDANLYAYCEDAPAALTDPSGLAGRLLNRLWRRRYWQCPPDNNPPSAPAPPPPPVAPATPAVETKFADSLGVSWTGSQLEEKQRPISGCPNTTGSSKNCFQITIWAPVPNYENEFHEASMTAGHSGFSIPGSPTYGFHGHDKGFINDDEDMKTFGKHSVWECCCVSDARMQTLRQLMNQAIANQSKLSFGKHAEHYPVGAASVLMRGLGDPPYPTCHGQSAYFAHAGLPEISLNDAGTLPNTLETTIRGNRFCRLKEIGPSFRKTDTGKRKN